MKRINELLFNKNSGRVYYLKTISPKINVAYIWDMYPRLVNMLRQKIKLPYGK